ncbi:MAG: RNA pseudouridine synthase, partial [Prevotella sp.]
PRQALHAQTLGFVHPVTGRQMDFTSPMPKDLEAVIQKWRDFINGKATTAGR